MKNNLFILIGPPGVGKSYYVKKNLPDTTIISRDDVREKHAAKNGLAYNDLFSDEPRIVEINADIKAEVEELLASAVAEDKDVAIDMTNINRTERSYVLSRFPKDRFQFVALDFMIDPDNFEKLVRSNELRDIEHMKVGRRKTLPRHFLKIMIDKYEKPTEEEGFDIIKKIDTDTRLTNLS
jgi:hypothetical protein